MRAVKYGALGLVLGLSIAWLFVQADRISTPAKAPSTLGVVVNGFPSGACDPDDGTPCGSLAVNEPTLGIAPAVGPVPRWLSCNVIKSDVLWRICYRNINVHHSTWRYVGSYDGHRRVWVIQGPTSVYVNRSHWSESS